MKKLKKVLIIFVAYEDEVSPDNYLFILCITQYYKVQNSTNARYLFRKSKYYKYKGKCSCKQDLKNESTAQINDDEFLLTYRIARNSFNKLVNLLKDHEVFKVCNKDKILNKTKTKEKATKYLIHFLFFLSTNGSGASNTNS